MKTTEATRPPVLQAGDKVALVAGSGRLPVEVAEALEAHGAAFFVLAIEGEVEPGSPLFGFEHRTMPLERFPEMLDLLRRQGATHLVLAGGVNRRIKLSAVRPSMALLRMLPFAVRGLARGLGDDALLRVIVGGVNAYGIKVVGAHQILPDLLAAEGPIGRLSPTAADRRDLDAALIAARAIGALDIGQAAVAIGGRVIALEGVEGTEGLLERTRDLRTHGRLASAQRGVLVKCAKPGQELRVDLPAIGPATVEQAHAAGLAGIGVEAGRSIVLDQAGVIARADALGLFVFGLGAEVRP